MKYLVSFFFVTLFLTACSSSSAQPTAPNTPCPDAPVQKVYVGGEAYVCTAGDTVKLHEGPGKRFLITRSLVPGAELKVVAGPTCADHWSWWQVKTESGELGWIAEGGDSIDPYFICPK